MSLDIHFYLWLALLEHHHLDARTVEEWDHPEGCEPCEKGRMPWWFPDALIRDLGRVDAEWDRWVHRHADTLTRRS